MNPLKNVMRQLSEQNNGIYELAKLDFYTEGPAVDMYGNVYATTLSGGEIVKIDLQGRVSTWGRSGCPNGQIILPDGDHLVCDSQLPAVRRFDSEGNFINDVIKDRCAGEKISVPNDLITGPWGNLFFTDSVRYNGKVFIVSGDREKILADNLDYPNGLAVSANGRRLYVAESYQNRILTFDISDPWNVNGSFSVFAELPKHPSGRKTDNLPDGLTIDSFGNIWVAHYGMGCIHQYSQEGVYKTTILTGMPLTSNLIFSDNKTVMVTGGSGEPGPGKIIKITI